MKTVNYLTRPFNPSATKSTVEDEDVIERTKHFVTSAKKLSAIVYEVSAMGSYTKFVAVANGLQMEIELDKDCEFKSIEMIKQLNPVGVMEIYSPTQAYRREYTIEECMNRVKDTIRCSECGEMTPFYGWQRFCAHCGHEIGSKQVKFCPECKDDTIYSTEYHFCPTCGGKLLEHPEDDMGPADFDTAELLTGQMVPSDYMDYDEIISGPGFSNRMKEEIEVVRQHYENQEK